MKCSEMEVGRDSTESLSTGHWCSLNLHVFKASFGVSNILNTFVTLGAVNHVNVTV